ncbi:MAG: hypothetical protein JWL93_2611 [Hyphomicrobiales bacterium]|nr:hypothetical protein [Hyphomicrobiales bacterium]
MRSALHCSWVKEVSAEQLAHLNKKAFAKLTTGTLVSRLQYLQVKGKMGMKVLPGVINGTTQNSATFRSFVKIQPG